MTALNLSKKAMIELTWQKIEWFLCHFWNVKLINFEFVQFQNWNAFWDTLYSGKCENSVSYYEVWNWLITRLHTSNHFLSLSIESEILIIIFARLTIPEDGLKSNFMAIFITAKLREIEVNSFSVLSSLKVYNFITRGAGFSHMLE